MYTVNEKLKKGWREIGRTRKLAKAKALCDRSPVRCIVLTSANTKAYCNEKENLG
jgi:hypothetical protein